MMTELILPTTFSVLDNLGQHILDFSSTQMNSEKVLWDLIQLGVGQ